MEKTLLNLIPGACSPEVHLSQYDKGRAVPFKLAEGKSAYSVPDGSEIVVQATKPSGLGFVVPVTFDGDTATMTITETMSNEYGRFPAELSITNNGNKIGTANFVMNIERSPHPEGTIDGDAESLLPELTLLVERIEAAADSVDEDTQTVTEAKAEVLQAKADALQAKADTLSARDDAVSAKDLAVSSAQTSVEASERAEELVGSVETKADAIVKTASGEIASFTDGGDDLPMKSLKVNIVPKQSGSGEPSPSNVRPISGWNEVNVEQRGKNLLTDYGSQLPYSSLGVSITGSGGEYTMVVNNASGYPFVRICTLKGLKKGTYRISSNAPVGGARIMNRSVSPAVSIGDQTNRFILTEDITDDLSVELAFTGSELTNGTYHIKVQLELGSTATAYEPYQGNTYPISLGRTVYGGTLDVVSGKGQPTYLYKEMTGGESALQELGDYYGWVDETQFPYCKESSPQYGRCSHFRYGIDTLTGVNASSGAYFLIKKSAMPTISSLTEFRNWVIQQYNNGTPLTISYELATPTASEFTTTPTEVKSLKGNNNIFADSGSVEVEYRADTTLAYNELVAMILENIGN